MGEKGWIEKLLWLLKKLPKSNEECSACADFGCS